jgi:hypothetical protein
MIDAEPKSHPNDRIIVSPELQIMREVSIDEVFPLLHGLRSFYTLLFLDHHQRTQDIIRLKGRTDPVLEDEVDLRMACVVHADSDFDSVIPGNRIRLSVPNGTDPELIQKFSGHMKRIFNIEEPTRY